MPMLGGPGVAGPGVQAGQVSKVGRRPNVSVCRGSRGGTCGASHLQANTVGGGRQIQWAPF